MGKIVAIAHEKGGVGKTTLAINLAVAAALDGIDVAIVDADRQGSCREWQQQRVNNAVKPHLICYRMEGKFAADLLEVSKRHELVIVDCPGSYSDEMRNAIAMSDLTLLPMRPGYFELVSLETMLGIIKAIERRAGIAIPTNTLINAASPSTTEADEILATIHDDAEFMLYFPPLSGAIHDRVSFRRTLRVGRSVLEESDAKAAQEVQEIYTQTIAPLMAGELNQATEQ